MSNESKLEHFPVTLFPIVMGLSGFALAWQKALGDHPVAIVVNLVLAAFASSAFVLIAVFYLAKLAKYPAAVKQEILHPVKLSFFPAISIGLVLVATVLLKLAPELAEVLWVLGAALQLALLVYVINAWVNRAQFEVAHLNPSWFIPAVGNVIVPIAGIKLGYVEVSWFFFSVGIMFWVVLLSIIFNRVLFHNPLPEKLAPTMVILIAPPAAGFISYTHLVDGLDIFGRFLFASGLFFTLFIVFQVPRFARLPFFLSWWAYSFPLAAITVASFSMQGFTGAAGYGWLGWALLVVLTGVIAVLVVRTIKAAMAGKICVPE